MGELESEEVNGRPSKQDAWSVGKIAITTTKGGGPQYNTPRGGYNQCGRGGFRGRGGFGRGGRGPIICYN
jgi:hypothetical protein